MAETREGATKQLAAMSAGDAEALVQWRGERLADGKTFSSGLPERLASWRVQSFPAMPEASALSARLQTTLAAYNYSGVRLFDSSGRAMISLVAPGVALQALDRLDTITFKGEESVLTPLSLVEGRKASMILSVPLWYQGAQEGRLSFLIEPQAFLARQLGADSITPDGTHAMLLQDVDGDLLWFASQPAFATLEQPENTEGSEPGDWRLREVPPAVAAALAAWRESPQEASRIFVDDSGVERFVHFEGVPDSPWVVMSTSERMAVCGPCIKRQVTIGLALLLFYLLTAVTLISWRRAQLEREAARRNQVLSAAAAAMPGALYVADASSGSFNTLFISDGIYHLLGCKPDAFQSLPDFFVKSIHDEDRAGVLAALKALVASDDSVGALNYRAWRCDRSRWQWIEDRVFVERNERGKARQLYGVMFDITERKLAEDALRDHNQTLESLNAELKTANARANQLAEQASAASHAKSEFLANMSHEIRTPLNAIIGITDLLAETQLDDEQHQYANTLRGASRSLLALINDILDFSKIEKGRLTLERVAFPLDPLIEEVVTVAAVQADAKGLEFLVDVDQRAPAWLLCDPLRLRQVLINLLGNAVKFTAGGDVTLRVATVATGTMDGDHAAAQALEFSVSDTGIGIDQERQASLFEAFTQADSSTTRKFGGTGLGLSIASQLVALMGGTLRVESGADAGSRFFFSLPLEVPNVPEAPAPLPPDALRDRRALLLVEHEKLAELLSRQLVALGMQVEVAVDVAGARALLAGESPPELMVIDYSVVQSATAETIARLREQCGPAFPRTLVIAPGSLYGQAVRLSVSGLARVVTSKPVRRDTLQRALAEVFELGVEHTKATVAGRDTTENRTSNEDAPMNNACILVADDEPTNQVVLRKVLEKLGHRVILASNGREAIELLAQQPCDLVLMDVRMPEMNGHQATQAIRAADSTALNPRVPIIALTAEAVTGERESALEAGMDDFLTKPIEIASLRETIQRWLVSRAL
ncbi:MULTISPECIES: PAS domain-containing hybrid sensor histidine kinase/response regulator [Thiorhodovibrio]|uniref:PAS domain-containing hybrid sensor histidine kinase/response regulator n=1 Tax=Thiorhodovibrio TaxID=61593 RepID=UPI001913DABA|nr:MULTISPECIES: PAS domain-containing hybrid sensor histidine kinase/response regulator [Thiorhodovibrio]